METGKSLHCSLAIHHAKYMTLHTFPYTSSSSLSKHQPAPFDTHLTTKSDQVVHEKNNNYLRRAPLRQFHTLKHRRKTSTRNERNAEMGM